MLEIAGKYLIIVPVWFN